MKRMMVDIETLGLKKPAPIFEIGYVVFDEKGNIYAQRQIDIDLLDCMFETGFMPNKNTLDWWREQEYNPNEAPSRQSLSVALNMLSNAIAEHEVQEIWANSPQFDLEHLETHYDAVGIPVPWTHKMPRDYRTMKAVLGWNGKDQAADQHNALADATHQTSELIDMMTQDRGRIWF